MALSALAVVVSAMQLAQPAAAPSAAAPKRLIAVGAHVKVRATPTADGQLNGYLFKNMVVEVLERGAQPELVGVKQDYWYRVARGTLTGWAFGGFFSATLPPRLIDTYDLPDLNHWWGTRFGWSTEYYESGLLPTSKLEKLEMDDYRGLILMASRDSSEYGAAAWAALQTTLYPFLKKHGEDPKWQYLRDKVWDPAFIGEMAARHGGSGIVEALPESLLGDPEFKSRLCAKAGAALAPCARAPAAPR
jgi:hypothetical protein